MAIVCPANFDSYFLRYLGPGALPGMTLGTWLKSLYRNNFKVSLPYLGRAVSITAAATLNSIVNVFEERKFGVAVSQTKVHPPIFVLGAWRSGTTHLHNLLSKDTRFAFPNQYQVMNPHTFLSQESWMPEILQPYLPKTRPQDNVHFDIYQPQEDEFAVSMLCGFAPSFAWIFPQQHAQFDRYVDFEDATLAETRQWKLALDYFIRKLTYRYDRPLVLKSPMHTARIGLLLELYPDAKFIFIHRHPYEVYASSNHLTRKSVPLCSLQRYDIDKLCDRMVPLYKRLIDNYLNQRNLIKPGNVVEVSFDELDTRPLETLQSAYEQLDLPDFELTRQSTGDYLESISTYKKNTYESLGHEARKMIATAWSRSFEEWGYQY